MTGVYSHTIDTKGRVFMPAKLREYLGDCFYVTISSEKCLTVHSLSSWKTFEERFDELPYSQAKSLRPLFAQAAKVELDAQGRILIPQKLRAFAELSKNVVIVGISKRVEIWDADRWAAIEEEENNPDNLAKGMERLGF